MTSNRPTIKTVINQIFIHQSSILWAPTSSLRPTPLNYSLTHKASIFILSIPTTLGGFSLTIFLFTTLLMIFRFSSSVSLLGWEVFHRSICLFYLLSFPTGLGGFFTTIEWLCFHQQIITNCLIFFLSFPTGLGSFLSIDLAGFPPQFSYWVRRFFTKLPKWLHVRRGSRLRGKAIVMPWSRDGHVIPISSHPSFPTEPLQAPRRRHPHLSRTDSDTTYSRTDSDTTSHTSVLALSGKEVLRVLRSRGQAACLMPAREKRLLTDQRLSRPVVVKRETLYKRKPLEEPRVKWWERRLAGRGQTWLLERQHQLLPGLPCVVEARLPCVVEARLPCVVEARLPCVVETAEGLDVTLDDPAGLRRWILMDGWM